MCDKMTLRLMYCCL